MPTLTRRSVLVGAGGALAACASAHGQTDAGVAGGLAWRALAPMPAPAQEIYPTLWNGRILVAGGFTTSPDGPWATDRAWLYDPAADSWAEGPRLPTARHHPQLAVAAGRLYVVGGFAFKLDGAETGMWRMQAGTSVWDDAAGAWADAPPLPAPRGEGIFLAVGDRLHLIGGRSPMAGSANLQWTDHVDVADHLVLDPAAGRWEAVRPAPTARNSAAGVVLDGRIYVAGGRRVDAGNNAELEVYDPSADRWDALAPMPQAQGGLAAGVIGGRIVAFGGEYFGAGSAGVYPETWVYDPARDAWEAGPDMLTPRHGLGAVSIDDRLYAVGGATLPGASGTSAALEVLEAA